MAGIKEKVEVKIRGKKVMMFSKSYCPYCNKAKQILGKFGLTEDQYETMELDKLADGQQIQAFLAKLTGGNTVPRIFIDGKCIGGYSELEKLQGQKKLTPMLQK